MGDDIMEQAMVVVFPEDDPRVCQVSFRRNVPLLILQTASIEAGQMRFGERNSLDLRQAGSVVADGEKVSILSRTTNGQQSHLMLELHMVMNSEEGAKANAKQAKQLKASRPGSSPSSPPSKDEQKEISEQADEECSLLRAKSQKLQQRITTLEALSDRREKQMKRLLKRLDGAMQMLEALEDMLEQQRKAISAQKVAISALKEEGAVDEEEEEEEEEEEKDDIDAEDVSPEKLMALFQQAEQMEHALKQIEALGKAGLLDGGGGDGDVDAILSRLHALEEEKANFERMVAQSK